MSEKMGTAGFWRRLVGFLIDAVLLGLVGLGVGTVLFDTLASLPGPTRLIGLVVGVLYYGLLSSGMGGGRTLGMRVVGIKVVRRDGGPLALPAALWRALWLQAPFMLNGLMLNGLDQVGGLIYAIVAAMIIFGVTLANIILAIGNRGTGRLVHDLVSGASVVRKEAETPPSGEARGAVVLAGVAVVLVGVVTLGVSQKAKDNALPFAALLKTQAAVAQLPNVMDVGVVENTMTSFTGGGVTQSLNLTARVAAWPKDEQALADQIGKIVRQSYPLKPGQTIHVTLRRGYDIGIAQGWSAHGYSPR